MGSESLTKIHGNEGVKSSSERVGSAVFYGVSSLGVIFINKVILSGYGFPSFLFLACAQFLSTSAILYALSVFRKIEVPAMSWAIVREVAPISLMFFLNVSTGLGATKSLNLPMFTALRRFSILITMMGELHILGKQPSKAVVVSVVLMVGGAVVAALNDLAFDMQGYLLVLGNDLFTALNGIYLKRATLSGRFSKLGILFYNSLLSGIFMAGLYLTDHVLCSMSGHAMAPGQAYVEPRASALSSVLAYPMWDDNTFKLLFISATIMGTILNYATFLCTSVNSALTTTVVGCLKNVLTTYIGMVFMTGYAYTHLNFVGLNISIAGSLYYTYINIIKVPSGTDSGAPAQLPTRKDSNDYSNGHPNDVSK